MNSELFINAANMATTPRDMLVEALHPGIFCRNEDLEDFIMKATRYFDASGITKPMRSILVVGYWKDPSEINMKILRKMKNSRFLKKDYGRLSGDIAH